MRRLLLVVALVLLVAAGYRGFGSEQTGTGETLTLAQPAPAPGEAVHNFEVDRLSGGEFKLPDQGTYVLTFWSSLNRGSSSAQPVFESLAREYADENVSFAAVYVGGVPREEQDVPYAVIQDSTGKLTSMYNVKRVPRLFLINDGEVVLAIGQEGFYGDNKAELKQALEETLEEERTKN